MGTHSDTHEEHAHGSVKLYWIIFVVLAVLTFIEWSAYEYKPIKESALYVPILLSASLGKFVLVCGWYMHLKYDHKFLALYYLASFLLSLAVMVALGVLLF